MDYLIDIFFKQQTLPNPISASMMTYIFGDFYSSCNWKLYAMAEGKSVDKSKYLTFLYSEIDKKIKGMPLATKRISPNMLLQEMVKISKKNGYSIEIK